MSVPLPEARADDGDRDRTWGGGTTMGKQTSKTTTTTTATTVATAPAAAATAAQQTKTEGQGSAGSALTEQAPAIRFAQPKGQRAKSQRAFCSFVTTHGPGTEPTRCKLRVAEGHDRCVNHVPAESRLTAEEFVALTDWLATLTPEQRTVGFVRAIGWWKAKAIVGGRPEGDRVVGELWG